MDIYVEECKEILFITPAITMAAMETTGIRSMIDERCGKASPGGISPGMAVKALIGSMSTNGTDPLDRAASVFRGAPTDLLFGTDGRISNDSLIGALGGIPGKDMEDILSEAYRLLKEHYGLATGCTTVHRGSYSLAIGKAELAFTVRTDGRTFRADFECVLDGDGIPVTGRNSASAICGDASGEEEIILTGLPFCLSPGDTAGMHPGSRGTARRFRFEAPGTSITDNVLESISDPSAITFIAILTTMLCRTFDLALERAGAEEDGEPLDFDRICSIHCNTMAEYDREEGTLSILGYAGILEELYGHLDMLEIDPDMLLGHR